MIKLLVVDDEQGVLDFMVDFFGRRGHKIFTAISAKEGFAIVEKEKPQIILLDVKMTPVDGLQFLEQLRKTDKKTKVVMITVAEEPEIRKEAIALGADDFVMKPFTSDYLESIVIQKVQELAK